MTTVDAAVIIAGGSGQRLGGRDKPALRVNDLSLLDIALGAVGHCPRVVVGPPRALPVGILTAHEDPPGGGPAAGLAAGVGALPELPAGAVVAVLAADLPGIDRFTIGRLVESLANPKAPDAAASAESETDIPDDGHDGAVLVDAGGRPQYLIGVWRVDRLTAAIARRPDWHGAPLHELLGPLRVLEIAGRNRETDDVDTPEDWQRWQS